MLEASSVGNVEVDVIVDADPVMGGQWHAMGSLDDWMKGVIYCRCEVWAVASMQQPTSGDLIEGHTVLCDEQGVKKEAFCKGGLDALDRLQVHWTEVFA